MAPEDLYPLNEIWESLHDNPIAKHIYWLCTVILTRFDEHTQSTPPLKKLKCIFPVTLSIMPGTRPLQVPFPCG